MRHTNRTLLLYIGVASVLAALAGCGKDQGPESVAMDREPVVLQLTSNDEVFEANPIFSPDGQWVVFESDVSGNMDIWRIPAAGGTPEQLTNDPAFDTSPYWAPDGTKICFESDRSGFKNIWILDTTDLAAGPTALTSGSWSDGSPAWAPGGGWIAYESDRAAAGGTDVWVSPLGGGDPVRVTTGGAGVYHRSADWSPDGTQLVLESNRLGLQPAIYTVPAFGGAMTRLTPVAGYEGHPAWSPDGEYIAFESTNSGSMQIHAVAVDGSKSFMVTMFGRFWPRWSPDGDRIVFCVYGDPEPNVWIVEVER